MDKYMGKPASTKDIMKALQNAPPPTRKADVLPVGSRVSFHSGFLGDDKGSAHNISGSGSSGGKTIKMSNKSSSGGFTDSDGHSNINPAFIPKSPISLMPMRSGKSASDYGSLTVDVNHRDLDKASHSLGLRMPGTPTPKSPPTHPPYRPPRHPSFGNFTLTGSNDPKSTSHGGISIHNAERKFSDSNSDPPVRIPDINELAEASEVEHRNRSNRSSRSAGGNKKNSSFSRLFGCCSTQG
jgi:hypothetical protein